MVAKSYLSPCGGQRCFGTESFGGEIFSVGLPLEGRGITGSAERGLNPSTGTEGD